MEMIAVTGEQMTKIENDLFNGDGAYRADIAMALAGHKIAEIASNRLPASGKIALICGYGNNGGDGFAAAYFLRSMGCSCTCFFDSANIGKLSHASRYFHDLCEGIGIVQPVPPSLCGFDLIVDCILGIGIRNSPDVYAKKMISLVNDSGVMVISADIPSGLPPDGAFSHDCIVRADITVCMGYPKINTLIFPGKKYAGEIIVADIGFPLLPRKETPYMNVIDISCTAGFRKKLPPDINKYVRGHLMIVGGFDGMEGAAILSAKAALESGAGLVTIATTVASRSIIAGIVPEVMTLSINDSILGDEDRLKNLMKDRKISAILIGPGLGRTDAARTVVSRVLSLSDAGFLKRLVIDGDALYHISETSWVPVHGETVIMTPHVGEGARLLKLDSNTVKGDLISSVTQLRSVYKSLIVLKGASTVISDDSIRILSGGSNQLSTAGSGDILSGFCAGLSLNDRYPLIETAAFSVFCHAMSVVECGLPIMTASDILVSLRKYLQKIGYQTVA